MSLIDDSVYCCLDAIIINMGNVLVSSLCMCLVTSVGWAQDEAAVDKFRTPGRIVLESGNQLLSAGSQALRAGAYDEGIRLTHLGLEQSGISAYQRTAALSNLCGAYAAKKAPDAAIEYCSQSLEIDNNNWRAFSNRAYAHWLKGMHTEAASDLEAAAAINPSAGEIEQIRGLINQSTLQPRVNVEDRQ
ncbi:MAG: tetratricopeptide repeat protein [Gammaproteobacteria bacterium]|nr:tetratricopeptide repeat protein [Gammaproteobacteria bacterium]